MAGIGASLVRGVIWSHRGRPVPLEVYHGVPRGWTAAELLAEHARLGGTREIGGPAATEPGAPSWLPARDAWLQYRETLYRIADGVAERDPACIELAIRYIELRHIGSYSGFIRERLARRLKHVELSPGQRQRLHEHFRRLVLDGEHTQEFRDYLKLWRLIITGEQRERLMADVASRGAAAAAWVRRGLAR